jgi:hypothetical protein
MDHLVATPRAHDLSDAARRMRLYRQRKRDRLRCFTIELRETEIEALMKSGLLEVGARSDPAAVAAALYAHLEATLV